MQAIAKIDKLKNSQQGMTLIELSVVLLILIALAGVTIPYIGGTGRMAMCQATDATMHAVKEAIMGGGAGPGYYGDMQGEYPKATKGLTVPDYSLSYLFTQPGWDEYNPKIGVGWRGPYLGNGAKIAAPVSSHFVTPIYAHAQSNGQFGVNDAWGRPLVFQVPSQASCDMLTGKAGSKAGECARLVSAGPGSGSGADEADIDTLIDDDPSTAGPAEIEAMRSNDDRILYLQIPTPSNDDVNAPCDEA